MPLKIRSKSSGSFHSFTPVGSIGVSPVRMVDRVSQCQPFHLKRTTGVNDKTSGRGVHPQNGLATRSILPKPATFRRFVMGMSALGFLMISGCAHLNNPFKDAGAMIEKDMTTVSADGFRGKAEFTTSVRRNWPKATLRFENGAVTHWPLGFEGTFENMGNRLPKFNDPNAPDDQFAWNAIDYGDIFYGLGRTLVNVFAFPITEMVTPPGTLMESDGRFDKLVSGVYTDAKRSNASLRPPPDVVDVNMLQYKIAAK